MRKYMVALTILLWIAVGLKQVWIEKNAEPVSVAEVFDQEELPAVESRVRYCGSCPEYLEGEERANLLKNLAEELHISHLPESVTEKKENGSVTWTEAEGRDGTTRFTYLAAGTWLYDILVSPRCYVTVELHMDGHTEEAVFYRNRMEEAAEELGLSGSASLELSGGRPGKDGLEEYEQAAADLFDQLGAEEVSSWKTEELYRIYGYSPRLGMAVYRGENAFNLSFAAEYDEQKDETIYRVGVPALEE